MAVSVSPDRPSDGRTDVAGGRQGIDYSSLAYLSAFDFAVVGSNNGHNGTGGASFLNAPETIIDFSHRSVHVSSQLSKSLAAAYYTVPHTKSYYVGCSTGGRQGFSAIRRYPADFDGVVAGSPALNLNHLSGWTVLLSIRNGALSGTPVVSPEQWEAVRLDILAECDGIDGVVDGIIDDPDRCRYSPARLLCSAAGANAKLCLTREQADVVVFVFSPLRWTNGELIMSRYDPGTSFAFAGIPILSGQFSPFALVPPLPRSQ